MSSDKLQEIQNTKIHELFPAQIELNKKLIDKMSSEISSLQEKIDYQINRQNRNSFLFSILFYCLFLSLIILFYFWFNNNKTF